jgi:hypothetical protein
MKRLLILGLLLIFGCKGPKGDQGAAGPGRVENIIGAVVSDTQPIYDSRIGPSTGMDIYVGPDSSVWFPIPVYSPGPGTNCGYTMSSGLILLMNAYSQGHRYYNIVFVSKNAPPANMKERVMG